MESNSQSTNQQPTVPRYRVRDDIDGYQIGDLEGVEVILAADHDRLLAAKEAQVADLERELAAENELHKDCIADTGQRIMELEAALRRLREAIGHSMGCQFLQTPEWACTCGQATRIGEAWSEAQSNGSV